MRLSIWFFGTIFAVLSLVFLLEYHFVGQSVYGDGRYYWAITRSLYFSHNIDVSDEMAHYYSPKMNNKPAVFTKIKGITPNTKEVANGYSLGVSLLWLPFYGLADIFTLLFHGIRNGYSNMYQIAVGIGDIAAVIGGLVVIFRLLLERFSKPIALLSIVFLVFATNLFYYASVDVVNSHQFSFFLSSILVFVFFLTVKNPKSQYFFLQGILVGLLGTVRTQDFLFIALPLGLILKNSRAKPIRQLLFFCFGTCLGYLPQLALLWISQGHFVLVPHTTQQFSLLPIHFFEVLFSTKLGVFFYTPVVLFALYGLLLLWKKFWYARIFFVVFCLHVWLISSWYGWGQAAYSMRYFIGSYPLLVFGLAEVLTRLKKRVSWGFLITCTIIFILHQLVMIAGFKLFLQDSTNVGANLSQSGQVKLKVLDTLGRLKF